MLQHPKAKRRSKWFDSSRPPPNRVCVPAPVDTAMAMGMDRNCTFIFLCPIAWTAAAMSRKGASRGLGTCRTWAPISMGVCMEVTQWLVSHSLPLLLAPFLSRSLAPSPSLSPLPHLFHRLFVFRLLTMLLPETTCAALMIVSVGVMQDGAEIDWRSHCAHSKKKRDRITAVRDSTFQNDRKHARDMN